MEEINKVPCDKLAAVIKKCADLKPGFRPHLATIMQAWKLLQPEKIKIGRPEGCEVCNKTGWLHFEKLKTGRKYQFAIPCVCALGEWLVQRHEKADPPIRYSIPERQQIFSMVQSDEKIKPENIPERLEPWLKAAVERVLSKSL
jgi:hypothetical protein